MLGPRLRILRELNGLTQKQVADVLNIDRSTYSYYEIAKTRPDIDALQKLADLFKVSTDYLLDYKSQAEIAVNDDTNIFASSRNLRYVSELSRSEKQLVLYFRLLKEDDKVEFMDNIKEICDGYLSRTINPLAGDFPDGYPEIDSVVSDYPEIGSSASDYLG